MKLLLRKDIWEDLQRKKDGHFLIDGGATIFYSKHMFSSRVLDVIKCEDFEDYYYTDNGYYVHKCHFELQVNDALFEI